MLHKRLIQLCRLSNNARLYHLIFNIFRIFVPTIFIIGVKTEYLFFNLIFKLLIIAIFTDSILYAFPDKIYFIVYRCSFTEDDDYANYDG